MSGNGNRIAFISRCDFTGDNPNGEQHAFLLDRGLGTFTQLDDCPSHLCSSQSLAISRDGSTVVGYDVDYPDYYLMIHTIDASGHATSSAVGADIDSDSFDGLLLGTGAAIPAVSADGKRIAFTGRITFQGQNPGHWMQVMVLDNVAGGGLKYVTDVDNGAAYGTAMDASGRNLFLLTNTTWHGKNGGLFHVKLNT